ncbi:restriction endonuclease subunit S [Actinobacillus equuli]|uniref:Restriction modification system DNA specificity subunit n=1 Tax=Actinobacillus equuli TaxID=718 RepID=A0AAX3FMX0_ACTEU|nr:restriction endonuclease subunit S [Actinobacillus equuli]AIZ80283.1 type I DNA restriction-modification [Actinobacillus equuli subsp. equuli]WGE44388.1 restriction endonuclease subunit S [Actinobacillus equuli subsp. equuli]VEE91660.1 restriction modification system DNA specificity subunit [Actinobacillus equuli]
MEEYKLQDLISIKNGKKYDHLNKGNIPVYGSGGIMTYVDDYLYDGEAVLLPRKGTLNNIMYSKGKLWTVDTMYYALVNEKADPYYLYAYLSQLNLSALDSGSTLPSMTSTAYYSIPVKLPNKKNQQKIAQVLSTLDRKIALNQQINAELEKMAKTLYDYWFVQFDFPDENGNPYKSSGGEMFYHPELKREVPKGWVCGMLDDLGQIVGGSTPSTTENANFSENAIAWITPNDLSNNQGNKFISHGAIDVSEQGIKSASLKIYPKGTVLLSSRAPVGYMAIAQNELTTNQGFKSFIPNKGYSEIFIYYAVKNLIPVIEQNASGSTFKEISATGLKNIPCLLPQKEIIENFVSKITALFEKQSIVEKENKKLIQLRDFLLPMLMNGQVEVA